ncbi:MAG: penicillin-binding protein activator LpoB [Candidatus Krumholzibacteriia bacterium]|nr:penicillin-binding protein activator LpoB [bacterium]MCB9516577.1 penicillin-binding protein activator LpoB [Candidatus Latescibacterota bacterium]
MKRNPILLVAVLALAAVTLLGGCSKTQVTRVDTDTTIDMSGHWNDADSRMVADAMIADCLSSPWLNRHAMAEGKNPVVIVGSIRNKTTEHIATDIFLKDLERACVVSGLVDIVASADERDQIRGERLDQRVNADPETVKQMGLELGADYMLIGTINEQGDAAGGSELFFFSTDLELIKIQTNQKVWIGNHKIKKVRQKGRYKG